MSLPSITVPAVLIWNSASEVRLTPAVVSFTPVGCQPVLLASGKPHARSCLTQFTPVAASTGGGLAALLGFGAGESGWAAGGAGVAASGAAASDVHSDGASLVGVGAGAAASFLQATSDAPVSRMIRISCGRRRRPGNESIIRPPGVNTRRYSHMCGWWSF